MKNYLSYFFRSVILLSLVCTFHSSVYGSYCILVPEEKLLTTSYETPAAKVYDVNISEQQKDDGVVVLPAEKPTQVKNRGKLIWEKREDAKALGNAVMQAHTDFENHFPMNSNYEKESPSLEYKVNFKQKGPYYIWIRGRGNSKDSSTVHVGLEGKAQMTGSGLCFIGNSYHWSNARNIQGRPRAWIHVPETGEQTLTIWMGDAGCKLDEILLTPVSIADMSDDHGYQDFALNPGDTNTIYDVVVYDASPGGIFAAVAAARRDRSVLLLEDTKHIGGIYVNGINHQEDLDRKNGITKMETEFFIQKLGKYGARKGNSTKWAPWMAERAFNEMLSETKVFVRKNQLVDKVEKSGNQIKQLTMTDGSVVKGKIFIDASYFGDLMARAGVSYATGREAKSKYNEPLAGIYIDDREGRWNRYKEVKDSLLDENGKLLFPLAGWLKDYNLGDASPKTMAHNIRLTTTKIKENWLPFPKPEEYDPKKYELLLRFVQHYKSERLDQIIAVYYNDGVSGKSQFNNPNLPRFGFSDYSAGAEMVEADYEEREQMIQKDINYALGIIYFLQHDPQVPKAMRRNAKQWGLAADEYADNSGLPTETYVRTGRRMIGRYVMTQKDLIKDKKKDDAISDGLWPMDSHGVQLLAIDKQNYVMEGGYMEHFDGAYQIPYRSITPLKKECSNLLVPVVISSSYVAMTSLRLEPTWMPTGVAAGMAADLALEEGKAVQDISVPTLQNRLKKLGHNIRK